jgi:hypothetical protein
MQPHLRLLCSKALRFVGSSGGSVADQGLSQFEQAYPGCYTPTLLAGRIIENRSECPEPGGLIDVH